jgi:hypothetical protein
VAIRLAGDPSFPAAGEKETDGDVFTQTGCLRFPQIMRLAVGYAALFAAAVAVAKGQEQVSGSHRDRRWMCARTQTGDLFSNATSNGHWAVSKEGCMVLVSRI